MFLIISNIYYKSLLCSQQLNSFSKADFLRTGKTNIIKQTKATKK